MAVGRNCRVWVPNRGALLFRPGDMSTVSRKAGDAVPTVMVTIVDSPVAMDWATQECQRS
jgi:hypothetical protein